MAEKKSLINRFTIEDIPSKEEVKDLAQRKKDESILACKQYILEKLDRIERMRRRYDKWHMIVKTKYYNNIIWPEVYDFLMKELDNRFEFYSLRISHGFFYEDIRLKLAIHQPNKFLVRLKKEFQYLLSRALEKHSKSIVIMSNIESALQAETAENNCNKAFKDLNYTFYTLKCTHNDKTFYNVCTDIGKQA